MRLALALAALVVAAAPARAAETMTKSEAARPAFMAELAPHTCGFFQQNVIAVAAWMTNNEILQADLLRKDRFGPDVIDELSKFEISVTRNGVEQTCNDLYRTLGPSGADLVQR